MNNKAKSILIGDLSEAGSGDKPERRDAAANRALILETAVQLFDERGVADVHMTDIAQAAGVGKGTLYRRFANKAELCLALMDSQMVAFQEQTLAQFRNMSAAGVSKMAQLDYFLDRLVTFTQTHMPLLCEVQREGLFHNQAEMSLPHFWQYMTVNGLLQAAMSEGEIPDDLDIGYLSDALLSPLKIDIFRFQRQVREFPLERISAGLRSLAAGLQIQNG